LIRDPGFSEIETLKNSMKIGNWKLEITNTKERRKIALVFVFLLLIVSGLTYWKIAYGVTRTWDGGGVDGTCGGAGTANNWSCAANWSGDTAPTGSDIALFDGTSTKNATINANISVAGIDINTGYTGTITQSGSYTVTVGSSHYDQAAGTFTGGSGAITVNGTFTLSSGTFTSTSGTMTLGNVSNNVTIITNSGGTFNHNNGTITFVGDGATHNTYTLDANTTLTLYNVIVNMPNNNDGVDTASGDTVVVANDFAFTAGHHVDGVWQVQNNVTIGASAGGGDGTLTMTGAGAHTYASSGGIGPILAVNNASAAVSPAGGTTSLKVSGLSILAGSFTAPSGMMTIDGNDINDSATILNIASGAVFNHSNGGMTFLGDSVTHNTYTIDAPTTLTLYDVTINMPSNNDVLTTASGDTVIVAGTLTYTAAHDINGTWEAQGNVIIGTAAEGGTATLAFTGGNNQTYTDQGGDEPDGDITVNKSGGTVTLASGAGWNATNQDLTITAGTLASATYNITTTNLTVNGGTFTGGSGTVTTAGPMLVSSGTFTGGAGNIDVNNVFTLSGGTFTSTSGTFTVNAGNTSGTIFTVSGGTWNHNNGTVTFSSQFGSSVTQTIDVNTTLTLYNVSINGTDADDAFSVAGGDTVIAANDFTHMGGKPGGAWEVQGNVIIGSGADGGGGTVTMTGTGSKTYAYSVGGIGPHLRVNNASISVAPAGGTTDLNLVFFSLLAGSFTAPSGTFTVGTSVNSDVSILVVASGGTFDHNGGGIVFTSAGGSNNTQTIDVDTTLTLHSVTVSGSDNDDNFSVASGDTLVLVGNLIQTNSRVNGTWEVQGNTTIATTADGGGTTLAFTGNNDQTYTDQGGNEPDGDITVNKSGGTVTLASNADWNATNQDLTVTVGTLRVAGASALSTTALTVGSAGVLKMTGTGDLTLAGNASNAGQVIIESNQSCGGTDEIQILSSSAGVQRTWSGTGSFTIYDATVKDQGGSAAITAYSSTSVSGNGGNWTFSGAACPNIPPIVQINSGELVIGSGEVNFR
jgi:hypothetical protein